MELLHVVILAGVQGLAELLPVSSSAQVILVEKLLGLDPTSPSMTLLLVMLHSGTMGAVRVHFGGTWRRQLLGGDAARRRATVARLAVDTALTGAAGLMPRQAIRHLAAPDPAAFEVEHLFGNARQMASALAAAGLPIVWRAWRFGGADASSARRGRERSPDLDAPTVPWTPMPSNRSTGDGLTLARAAAIGAVQGLCRPFRGFSRSGATISAGLLLGVQQARAEAFSVALAVVLTPAVIVKEAWRLVHHAGDPAAMAGVLGPCLLGAVMAFLTGLAALRWLSAWLDQGRWHWFGVYGLGAAGVVLWVG